MPKKILLVDDSVTARKIVIDHLTGTDLQIIEAEDGNAGIKKLAEHPDVVAIFSDINMPWMNGLEMVGKIKENENLKHIPICMLTTESAPEALAKAKQLGVNAFLVKPVDLSQLQMVIKSFIK